MATTRVTSSDPARARADVLIVAALFGHGAHPQLLTPPDLLQPETAKALQKGLSAVAPGAQRDPIRLTVPDIRAGSVIVCPVADGGNCEQVRRAIGSATRTLEDARSAVVIPPGTSQEILRATAEGALLGAYRFNRYRSTPRAPLGRISLTVPGDRTRAARAVSRDAEHVIRAVTLTRDLVNTAPNDLSPQALAEAAALTFAETSVSVKVWDHRALRRGGFGGLTAVGQGSVNGARLVRLRYRHPQARHHVALVGKGITFDSGGLSLKPAKAMEWMKADMAGAAAVLGTVRAAHDLALPVNVTGWLAAAENMPSGSAQRPGDVITIRGGKTVEVLNTDAEGRLVLADALVEAAKEEPDELIDIATLTGAQLIALGTRVAGVMGNDDQQRDALVAQADTAGESMWPMPLPTDLRPSLDSAVADLANIGDRNGGMLTAALFLQEFIPPGIPWTHLDIAGPAFNEGAASGYTPKGATGFGVRTLLEHLRAASVT